MNCDKCGQEVKPENDATILSAIVWDNNAIILCNSARHLLPTDNCEGSPSRAQYLEGQPRDERPYAYTIHLERLVRQAYAKMQNLALAQEKRE